MKYEAELNHEILEMEGHKSSSLHYESECIEEWIESVRGAYPKLCDYEGEWINYYLNNAGIGEFPYEAVTNVTDATIHHTVPIPFKRAILSGRTLVNVVPSKTIDYTASSDWDGYNAIAQNSTVQGLKANTKYFISCYVETFNNGENQGYLLNNPDASTVFDEFLEVKATGLHKWLVTSKSEFTEEVSIALRCQNRNARGAIKIRDIMIIEYQDGMENWDMPYFEGMASVKMPGLTTVGKNLFNYLDYQEKRDYTKYEPEKIIINSPKQYLPTQYDLVLEEGKTYVISCEKTPGGEISIRRSDDSSLFYDSENTNCKTAFVAENNLFLRISNRKIINEDALFSHIQIEEGATATPFEPYQSNILTVNEDVTLGSNGSVYDELDLLTGKLTQRIDENGGVLSQEIVKTVELSITNQEGVTVNRLKSMNETTHIKTNGTPINPFFTGEIAVEAIGQNLNSFIEQEGEQNE